MILFPNILPIFISPKITKYFYLNLNFRLATAKGICEMINKGMLLLLKSFIEIFVLVFFKIIKNINKALLYTLNMVVNMNEEEEKLKIAFMSYFNHFINNATKVIESSNVDKPTKQIYKSFLADLVENVQEFFALQEKYSL